MGARRNGSLSRRGKKTVEQRINAKRATAYLYAPERGYEDPHTGEVWGGFGKLQIKYRDLDADNHATDAVDDRVLASGDTNAERAVGSSHIKTGEITDAHVQQRWAKTTQHTDTLYKNAEGKLPATDLPSSVVTGSYNGNPGKLGYGDIGGTPDLSGFVKDAAIKGFQNKKQVQKIVKDMVKKSALGN